MLSPKLAYNSCRNRHCPKCRGLARADWLAARQGELLPAPYFHLVFTLPASVSASHRRLDPVEQQLVVERLFDEVHGAGLHRLNSDRNVAVAGEDDDLKLDGAFGEFSLQLQPAHAGDPHIQQQAPRAAGLIGVEKILRRRVGLDTQINRLDQPGRTKSIMAAPSQEFEFAAVRSGGAGSVRPKDTCGLSRHSNWLAISQVQRLKAAVRAARSKPNPKRHGMPRNCGPVEGIGRVGPLTR